MAGHATSELEDPVDTEGNRPECLTNRLLSPHHRITPCRETPSILRFRPRPVNPQSLNTDRTLRALLALIALVASAVVALSLSGTAAAATPCGKKVLADWFDNGRIDRLYPPHCYEEAIDAIPDDLRDYADAEEVITRALQSSLRGELAPGGRDPTPGNDPDKDGTPGPGNNGNPRGGSNGDGDSGTGGNPQAAPDVDTSGPSSVPIPLLVLGGMSLALLAAGSLGYLSRRRQAAHADDLGDDDTVI